MQSFRQYRRIGRSIRGELGDGDMPPVTALSYPQTDQNIQLALASEKKESDVEDGRHNINQMGDLRNDEPRRPAEQKEQDLPIIVGFEDGDGLNPKRWTLAQRSLTTLLVLGAGIVGGWGSANESMIIPQARLSFGVSAVTESLSTGLYLVAFGVGSLVSGPFSETVGRNPVYITTLLLFSIFIMAAALAPNIGAQLAFRFLAGLFGCTALTTFSGSIADLWAPTERLLALAFGSTINFSGVFLAPCVGAFIGQSPSISWRWVEWVTLIMTGVVTALIFLFAPETYNPVILSWKASQLRKISGDPRYRSEQELKLQPLYLRLYRSIWRPFDILVHEITVVLFTIYLTVLYIVTFTFLTGYTYIYGDIYHFSQGSVGLSFMGLVVGILLGGAMSLPLHSKYFRDLEKAKGEGMDALPPESRLWFVMISAPCLPVGLFWMGWTADASISYWTSLGGSVLIGIAFLGIFVGSSLYLIDSFEHLAASALSIATFCRYVAAGVMIPVSIPMYENLGVHWTMTLLGCISVVLTPVPFIFYKYGAVIRARSRKAKEGVSA